MNVFHFGTDARRLFGIYTPGQSSGRTARAALLCAPWGQEYLRAHRSLRQLGMQLGAAGFHVLRFDYYGTGDSAGEMTDASFMGWEDDVGHALDELRDTSGASRVSIIGLRLGAALAARLSSRRSADVSNLVLWDPVISGRTYMKELRMPTAARPAVRPRTTKSGGLNVNGFVLTSTLEAELTAFDLVTLADRLPARTLVVFSAPDQAGEGPARELRGALTRRKGPVVEVLEAPPAWLEYGNTGAAVTPVAVLQRITQWLT